MKEASILKSLWRKMPDGRWSIHDIRGISLRPRPEFNDEYFTYKNEMELMTNNPATSNSHEFMTSFGSTDFLMKQSILPVVAWVNGEKSIRCIGTAFVISCTGYVVTACHVLLDPFESGYGDVVRRDNNLQVSSNLRMGVLVPINPASGQSGNFFLPFVQSQYWGDWKESPLFHERDSFVPLTDIAICKIPLLFNGVGHQPLNLSLNPFINGEKAYAFGYAEMEDIPMEILDGKLIVPKFHHDLYVSVGEVMNVYAENHKQNNVSTPGPCFDFKAKIPGKMSGGPILGADGAVVRGVISRSFSGEKHAYGAMLGPIVNLPLEQDTTLKKMMDSGNEGIAKIHGLGL